MGDYHSCVVSSDTLIANPRPGFTFCWGRGDRGQLGDGSTTDRSRPTQVAGDLRFESLAAGSDHTCGIEWDVRAVYCWGSNDEGRLGDGTTSDRNAPVRAQSDEGFMLVSASRHTCAVTNNGEAFCWGPNEAGQLGDGTTTGSTTPTLVSGGLTFSAIVAGDGYTCGVAADRRVYCWGSNNDGQLGDGTTTESSIPVPIAGSLEFVVNTLSYHSVELLAAGGSDEGASGHHTCAVADQGFSVTTRYVPFCWGSNGSGQLGNGSTNAVLTAEPVMFEQLDVLSLHSGYLHTCALTFAGAAYCWGNNGSGQLGDGTTDMSAVPVRVSALRDSYLRRSRR